MPRNTLSSKAKAHSAMENWVWGPICVIEESFVRASRYVVKGGQKLPNPVKKLLMIVDKHNHWNAGST